MRKMPLCVTALAALAVCVGSVQAQPVNDNCANASEVFNGDTPFDAHGATTDGPEEPGCNFPGNDPQLNKDVWFKYVATATGPVTVSTCSQADYDTKLGVYGADCPAQPGSVLACNDDAPGCDDFTSKLSFDATEGGAYLIRLGAFRTVQDPGSGTLTITPVVVPDNDDCGDAAPMRCNTSVEGSTDGASADAAPECGTTVSAPGVWYSVTGTGGQITVETCDEEQGYDTKLNVYKDGCETLTCVGGNDDECGPEPARLSRVVFDSEEGVEYLILVQGFDGATGPFVLTVNCAQTGEDCNNNGIPDVCDLSCLAPGCDQFEKCGLAADCNGNEVPDECEGEGFRYQSRPNVPIPDNDPNGVSDTINVPDSGNIADVNVNVSIVHTFIGDLTIDVEHAGITVRLWDRQCAGNDDLDIIFDDEGDPVLCATPTVGRFQPVQPLDVYDNGDITGDWTIKVVDNAPQDIGTLVAWGITGTLRGFECCVAVQTGSNPPDGAIDAREEHKASEPGNLTGLRAFVLTFDDNTSVVRQCFSVAETGGGEPPVVVRVDRLENNEVRVNFNRPITVQEWTTLAYNGVGGTTLTDVGFLPGDVNQSRQSTGRDISELIDCLNGIVVCADYQTDINRSGDSNGNDITALINVLQASSEYPREWLNETIVEEPNP